MQKQQARAWQFDDRSQTCWSGEAIETSKMSIEEDPFGDNTNPQNTLRVKGDNLQKLLSQKRFGNVLEQLRDGSLDAVKDKVNDTAATLGNCGSHAKVFKQSIAGMERTITNFLEALRIVYVRGGWYYIFLRSKVVYFY